MLTITPKAAHKIRELLEDRSRTRSLSHRSKGTCGIRVGVSGKGCNGLSYIFEYADKPLEYDEIFTQMDITIFVDPKALIFIAGTTIDYEEGLMQSGFTFSNPLATSTCGCGESFSTQ